MPRVLHRASARAGADCRHLDPETHCPAHPQSAGDALGRGQKDRATDDSKTGRARWRAGRDQKTFLLGPVSASTCRRLEGPRSARYAPDNRRANSAYFPQGLGFSLRCPPASREEIPQSGGWAPSWVWPPYRLSERPGIGAAHPARTRVSSIRAPQPTQPNPRCGQNALSVDQRLRVPLHPRA